MPFVVVVFVVAVVVCPCSMDIGTCELRGRHHHRHQSPMDILVSILFVDHMVVEVLMFLVAVAVPCDFFLEVTTVAVVVAAVVAVPKMVVDSVDFVWILVHF